MTLPRLGSFSSVGLIFGLALALETSHEAAGRQAAESVMAIVGATVIDGRGGPPLPDATVLIKGTRIAEVGPRASVAVPPDATVIDGTGKSVTPGFIDTNVHVSLYGAGETLVRYQPQVLDLIQEGAQLHLKYGVTTIRDSYGQLDPLKTVRDAIARGETTGPRMLVAGNIVGWGGPRSASFGGAPSGPREELTLFQQQMQDLVTQGAGEELFDMTPEQVRVAINQYLDRKPDFIKYGGTSHTPSPAMIALSPDAQRAIVEETHKRGLMAETHSTTPEAMRVSVLAGVDLIQHPESMAGYEMPDDLVRLIVERKVICAMLENKLGGPYWKKHLKDQETAKRQQEDADKEASARPQVPKTKHELRQEQKAAGRENEMRRVNALKLIQAGAIISVATDNHLGYAPEFRRTPKEAFQEPGLGTIIAIESLVEIGVPAVQAIAMATSNGARACRMEKDLGTVQAGKIADLLVIDGDPTADIASIRKLHTVLKDGRKVDIDALPVKPVFSRPAPSSAFTARDRDRAPARPAPAADVVTALVGATVIDGTGAPARADTTVLVKGGRILAMGPRGAVPVPPGATVMDVAGKFITPGFIDVNVHVSMFGSGETVVRYQPRTVEVTLEAAQLHLKYGVTTVRDSYGQLEATRTVRDVIARGEAVGPRMLVAGNIVGWGGPSSRTFSGVSPRDGELSLFEEQLQDVLTEGAGEDLIDMTPAELRVAINRYLDKGPDFIKYGGTTHTVAPSFIDFSPEAQKVIVEETHKRGRVAETHSTNAEGLRLSVEAGIDLIQHPEALGMRELPDDLVRLIVSRGVINAILANKFTGPVWKKHLKDQEAKADREQKDREKEGGAGTGRAKTQAELRAERRATGVDLIMRRVNAQKLMAAGAIIAVSTDNVVGSAPELARQPIQLHLTPGLGTIMSIEGLVEIGMTPLEAIKAATRHGALACRMEKDLGTIEPGKIADLLVLDADPLAEITNIRKLRTVLKEGRVIDVGRLPTSPVFYRPPVQSSTSQP